MRRILPILAALLGLPVTAQATENFPPYIQFHRNDFGGDAGVSCPTAPPTATYPVAATYGPDGMQYDCTLCHIDDMTAYNGVRTPFGVALRARGLVAEDEASLQKALDSMAADGVDSDHDGYTDVCELSYGTDPNVGPAQTATPLKYGCSIGTTSGESGVAVGLGLVGLGLVALRRSRRRRSA